MSSGPDRYFIRYAPGPYVSEQSPKADIWDWNMYSGKYSLLNDIMRWRSCSGATRGCVNRIRLWPLRRSDWCRKDVARVLANDERTIIDR